MKLPSFELSVSLPKKLFVGFENFVKRNAIVILLTILSAVSLLSFLIYLENGLGLAYNDARSHLDIGRRVVEGLKPGLAQLGSVWLPLPHLLMVPTIWNDFFWHTGLSGAVQSMISFIATSIIIYLFLRKLGASLFAAFVGVVIFVANINILYLQSTAMTELLLIATMTIGVYELTMWFKNDKMVSLIHASFWIMLATLIRYDGWFLLFVATLLVVLYTFKKKGYKATEGTVFFFLTVSALGIVMWFLWNLLIFGDPLYFAFGPYSAHAQQEQLEGAGVLATKHNLLLSMKIYLYALAYNSGALALFFGIVGLFVFLFDKTVKLPVRIAATLALTAPFFFNVLALFLGHSVLFIQGLSGNTWFNVRYGVMMMPSIAIFIGYLVYRAGPARFVVLGLLVFSSIFTFLNNDAVTIDDATVGSSQKNVSEVSGWLKNNAKNYEGFVLISAASHDAIIFSSTLSMSRFIHEGTGAYWESATTAPDRWARWIVMRTNDNNDQTFRLVSKTGALSKYDLVQTFPFADIYELKPEYLDQLETEEIFKGRQK